MYVYARACTFFFVENNLACTRALVYAITYISSYIMRSSSSRVQIIWHVYVYIRMYIIIMRVEYNRFDPVLFFLWIWEMRKRSRVRTTLPTLSYVYYVFNMHHTCVLLYVLWVWRNGERRRYKFYRSHIYAGILAVAQSWESKSIVHFFRYCTVHSRLNIIYIYNINIACIYGRRRAA